MRQLIVLSGKGGTGKTSVTAALAHLASGDHEIVLTDADVDAANLGIVTEPAVRSRHVFTGGQVAVVDADLCGACGECVEACRFDAIAMNGDAALVDGTACEGCAACFHRCPDKAIRMEPEDTGEWFVSDTRFGPLCHARLFPGRENSGKLVTEIRRAAADLAAQEKREWVLVDGPPGMGCPVIAASTGCDLALLVAEPSISGSHDLERVLDTLTHFGIPALACINKADLSLEWADRIEGWLGERDVPVVARLPFDRSVTKAMIAKKAITEVGNGPLVTAMRELYEGIEDRLAGRG
ncbi:MAG: ATP-binding protein [Planctomycetota bacterium]